MSSNISVTHNLKLKDRPFNNLHDNKLKSKINKNLENIHQTQNRIYA